jgi:hypothetical protein
MLQNVALVNDNPAWAMIDIEQEIHYASCNTRQTVVMPQFDVSSGGCNLDIKQRHRCQ